MKIPRFLPHELEPDLPLYSGRWVIWDMEAPLGRRELCRCPTHETKDTAWECRQAQAELARRVELESHR